MKLRILGAHSGETNRTRSISLLINDNLAIDAGGLTSALSLEEQKKIETVLITHPHYDHVRDIPGLALNLYHQKSSVQVYTTASARAAIEAHLLNGVVFPKFHELPGSRPTVAFNLIMPYRKTNVDGWVILALPVNHCNGTVGYHVTNSLKNGVFYTADTGPGLSHCWEHISPRLLMTDVTLPDSQASFAEQTGHLTPGLLEQELITFRNIKGYLPRIIAIHMDAALEPLIKDELGSVSRKLGTEITVAAEGMEISL